jgi:hypothetical protein
MYYTNKGVHICSSTAPKFNVPHFNHTALKVAKTYLNVTKKIKKLDNNDFKYPILNKMIG